MSTTVTTTHGITAKMYTVTNLFRNLLRIDIDITYTLGVNLQKELMFPEEFCKQVCLHFELGLLPFALKGQNAT